MGESWGKPETPPPPEKLGELITRFDGWVVKNNSTPKGNHEFVISVRVPERYKAMLMADQPGVMLHFEVYYRIPKNLQNVEQTTVQAVLGIDPNDTEIRRALKLEELGVNDGEADAG